jgi:hypothetical protein
VFGESYAGHWIPGITYEILKMNELNDTHFKIPIKSMAIGDPLIDPINQLTENGLFGETLGLLNSKERNYIENQQLLGTFAVKKADWSAA